VSQSQWQEGVGAVSDSCCCAAEADVVTVCLPNWVDVQCLTAAVFASIFGIAVVGWCSATDLRPMQLFQERSAARLATVLDQDTAAGVSDHSRLWLAYPFHNFGSPVNSQLMKHTATAHDTYT
jgi:hypothetical protein